jgi:imidazolonepropionase-like amidohydrolase
MARLVLIGATLIDGAGGAPVRDRAVVIEDGRIAEVTAGRPGGGPTLDLGGLTLLPGLINCHVHLCLGGEPDPTKILEVDAPALRTIKAVLRARQTLEAGITTVRDLGGPDGIPLAVRDAVRDGLVPGPRVLAAARGICMTGGHGWRFGREADGPDDVRRAVREQLKAGADVIKIFATGGVLTPGVEPGSPQLTAEEIRAAIEEARKAGRRTAAHAQAEQGIAACVAAGITSIEHGIYLTEPIARTMAREGIALVATLVAPDRIVSGGVAAGIPAFVVEKSQAVTARHVESFQLAMRIGVPIAAGTDAGTPLNPHGSIVGELALMVKAGMAPLDALRAATATAAHLLGLQHETGRVAPGLAADLLAVEGEPAERLEALDAVRLVIARGRIAVNRVAGGPR